MTLLKLPLRGNFLEDCEKYPDGTGGCYAYVSSYNQFEILDISDPNNMVLLSTYYAEVARMIDIKVTPDNNWVLVNHELTNSELDPIPNDDDANSGANRLDVIYVGDKSEPIKVAEWDNPPADSTTKTSTSTVIWTTGFMPQKTVIFSCSEQTPILKWPREIQVHSTRAHRFSTYHSGLNHGSRLLQMKSKIPVVKSSGGADIHLM